MVKLIADNYITQMKLFKLPVDVREQILFEIIDEQVKQNHLDLMTEITEYVDDVKKCWYEAECGGYGARDWEKGSWEEEEQDLFDTLINASGEDGYADMNYLGIFWFKNYNVAFQKKFKGFYDEMGAKWWDDVDDEDEDDPRYGYV
jgi:REP element-mobilizing transposase RayT